MSWRVVAASVSGTSHGESQDNCQDSCIAQVDTLPNQSKTLSIFVCDGAGSAKNGGEGAELAIEASAAFIASKVAEQEFTLNDELAVECVIAVRDRIFNRAEKEGLRARDYACTFLGLISANQGTLVLQIGDGGIVVDIGNGFELPVIPMSGEYANMTHFVTDEDAIDILVTMTFQSKVKRAALFSDGIQKLALNMATNIPYEPFFEPFFRVLTNATPQQEEQLESALVKFLNSDSVNKRTDDDKTLALALLME